MATRNREYYLDRINRMIMLMNKKEELEGEDNNFSLIEARNILIQEQKYLSDKSNKINKDKKKYLDKMVDDIDKMDNIAKDKAIDNIFNDFKNIINTLSEKEILSDLGIKITSTVNDSIERKLERFLYSYVYANKVLISRKIDNDTLPTIYDGMINYQSDIIDAGLIEPEFHEEMGLKLYNDFEKNNLPVSEKDRQYFEEMISIYKERINIFMIITNDELYNKLEQLVRNNHELLERENFPRLGALVGELTEEYLSQPGVDRNQRIYLEYKE